MQDNTPRGKNNCPHDRSTGAQPTDSASATPQRGTTGEGTPAGNRSSSGHKTRREIERAVRAWIAQQDGETYVRARKIAADLEGIDPSTVGNALGTLADADDVVVEQWTRGTPHMWRIVPGEPAVAADGGHPPDKTVWVRSSTAGERRDIYHTDPDCHMLERATSSSQKRIDVLPADARPCQFCTGEADLSGGQPPKSGSLRERLEDLDPDAIGQSDIVTDGGIETMRDPGNPELAPRTVRLKIAGEDAHELDVRFDNEPDESELVADGGTVSDGPTLEGNSEEPALELLKDHEHDLRKESVGKPRYSPRTGTVAVEVWVACTADECPGFWTGEAELSLDENAVEDWAEHLEETDAKGDADD